MTWGEIRGMAAAEAPGRGNDLLTSWIQRSYREILDHRDWQGLHQDGLLMVVGSYDAGTVALTQGSTAVTGTGTAFTTQMTGRKFRIVGGQEWYTFSYVSATSGTLDRPYEGETDATATYVIYQDRYALPGAVKLVETMGGEGATPLEIVRCQPWTLGQPLMWGPGNDSSEDTPPVLKSVELWPAPQLPMGIPYRYLTVVYQFDGFNTEDSPLPFVSEDAILEGTLYRAGVKDRTDFLLALANMNRVENERTPARQMQMADRFTAHRERRR